MGTELYQLSTQSPASTYAQLLRAMHQLIREGKGDSEQAETLADQMDVPWRAMTAQEQSRLRGLASDLHTLSEGGPKRVDMTREQVAIWKSELSEALKCFEAGDLDPALNFLSRPVPSYLPSQLIPFLQARCWEKLGDLETALEFVKEADRFDPEELTSILALLQQLGPFDDLSKYAERVLENRRSSA